MTIAVSPSDGASTFHHNALRYTTGYAYCAGIAEFLQHDDYDGPALVAVPAAHLEQLHEFLNGDAANVEVADMTELGANPSRIIPTALLRWLIVAGTGRLSGWSPRGLHCHHRRLAIGSRVR